mmetsp:Transcript_5266/g.15979  ORF Transcript_5266/g.15979 Transcript_5266/m.15979 type:complete len:137 (-) Transcript_5266:283-693(-)
MAEMADKNVVVTGRVVASGAEAAPPPQPQPASVAVVVTQQQPAQTQEGCCGLEPNSRGNVETHNCGECNYCCYLSMIITFGVLGGILIVVTLVVFWPAVVVGVGFAVASCVLCCCCKPPSDKGLPAHVPVSSADVP